MAASKDLHIDGLNIKLVRFNAGAGTLILAKIQNAFGGALMKMAQSSNATDEQQLEIIGQSLDALGDRLPPEKMHKLIQEVLCGGNVYINGTQLNSLDQLDMYHENTDPYYLTIVLFKEMVTFSFGSFIKKLMGGLAGSILAEPA